MVLGRLRVVVRAVRAPPSLADAAGLELGALVLPSYAGIARVAEQLHCAAAPGMEQFGLGRGSGSKGTSKLSRRRRLGARGLRSAALVSCRYRQVLPSFRVVIDKRDEHASRDKTFSLLTRPSAIAPWRLHDHISTVGARTQLGAMKDIKRNETTVPQKRYCNNRPINRLQTISSNSVNRKGTSAALSASSISW